MTDARHLQLDAERRVVRYGDASMRLSPHRFRALLALLDHAGSPVPVGTLIDALYGEDPDGGPDLAERVTRDTIRHLRQALLALGAPLRIKTLYHGGYGLVPA